MDDPDMLPKKHGTAEYAQAVADIVKRAPTPQARKFREAALELETDDSEGRFDRLVKGIAKAPPPKGDKAKDDDARDGSD